MNTKLKNEFKKVLQFDTQEDKTEHDSKILMFKFLSLIEQEMELRNMNKKDLAKQLGTSPSFVTQLFRGTKTINLVKLAQLQKLFNIEFEIKVIRKSKKKKTVSTIKKSKMKRLASAN